MAGQVLAGHDVVIRFRVQVTGGVNLVSNQGAVTYRDNTSGVLVTANLPTDDPATPAPVDPTVIGYSGPALSIGKTVSDALVRVIADPAQPSQLSYNPAQLVYTLQVKNVGASPATGVVITDTLPDGLRYVSAQGQPPLGGSVVVSGQTLSVTLPLLMPGETQRLDIVTRPELTPDTLQAALSNVAQVRADSLSTQASAPAVTGVVYPKLTKTVQNLTAGGPAGVLVGAKPGERLEYCLNFSNLGSVPLDDFRLADPVPQNTAALLDAYGAGLGIRLSRAGSSLLTSALDGDTGQLSATTGAQQGNLSVRLGRLQPGEQGAACFQVTVK